MASWDLKMIGIGIVPSQWQLRVWTDLINAISFFFWLDGFECQLLLSLGKPKEQQKRNIVLINYLINESPLPSLFLLAMWFQGKFSHLQPLALLAISLACSGRQVVLYFSYRISLVVPFGFLLSIFVLFWSLGCYHYSRAVSEGIGSGAEWASVYGVLHLLQKFL